MAVVAASLSRTGCQEKCGNITIPYPFGIGPECSANASFTLVCRNSTSEVLRISLYGTLTVNSHVSPLNCSSVQETHLATSLVGTPFTISSRYNSVLVLGCQNSITLHNSDGSTGGCTPYCDANTTQFDNDYSTYEHLLNHPLNPFGPELQYAPMVLQWEYEPIYYDLSMNCDDGLSLRSYIPIDLFQDYPSDGFLCYCRDGFTGNPYLAGECLDVDECSDLSFDYCPRGTCINTPGSYKCHDPRARVKIIFISIGSAFGALVLFLVSWVSTKAIRKRIEARRRHKFFTRNGGLLLQQQLSTTDNGLEKTKVFSSNELSQATDHYNENRVLGRGGQGTVYKGMLTVGRIVAIKKSKRVDAADLESFINEVVILSQVNHRNVVKLLGCCLETEVPLLVYEFIPNGTLLQHIQEPSEEFPLSWDTRLRIAREVAGALWYLHSAASTPIYHRDIKSTNILLDDKYRAIVSDLRRWNNIVHRSFTIKKVPTISKQIDMGVQLVYFEPPL